MNDIVERIDKLIKGWEREYGITNQTMVDAKEAILYLRAQIPSHDIMRQVIDAQNEKIEMMSTQLIIRRDMIEKLKSGPGGIMEMKQTIADRETLIEELLKSNWEKLWTTMRKYDTFEEYKDSVLK